MPVCCGLKSNRCQVPSSEPLSLTQGLCPIRSVCRWLAELQLFGITAATWAKGNAWNKLAPERRMTCGKVMPTHSLLCVFKPKWPLVEISRQRTETKHKNTGGARSYLQPPARGPCADKFLDVRGVISKRQTTYSSGAHLNPVSSFLQFSQGKQKVLCWWGLKLCMCVLLFFNRAKTC